jgi:hypothetical protein
LPKLTAHAEGTFYGNRAERPLKLVVVVLRAPSSSKVTSDTRMTQLERHDWKRQPMFEVKTSIAIPQNLWQDVGQNAAAKCNPIQMSGRD